MGMALSTKGSGYYCYFFIVQNLNSNYIKLFEKRSVYIDSNEIVFGIYERRLGKKNICGKMREDERVEKIENNSWIS